MPGSLFRDGAFPETPPPYIQKPLSVVESTFSLYGFLPADEDPRWPFLYRYEQVRREVAFKPLHFANAWGATYLSNIPSYKLGFVCSFNPENCLQLDRALDNLGEAPDVTGRYDASQEGFGDVDMRLARTDRLTGDPKDEVTPCPEAIYQIRLYHGRYLARVGFNLHQEDGATILSLVNIQGTPGSVERNADFETEFGTSPFNLLVRRALSLAEAGTPEYQVRGIINPARGNSQLYWCALSHESVEKFHAHHKPTR